MDIDNINLFNAARPSDDNIHSAVSNKEGTENLYFYHKKSPINTLNKDVSKFQKAEVKDIKKITTTTLNKIIVNSKFKDKKFNLLSIDVEGHELKVLEGFDFNLYSPDVIVLEFLDLSVTNLEVKNLDIINVINSDLYKLLVSKNYILVNCIYSDLIFIKKEFRDN